MKAFGTGQEMNLDFASTLTVYKDSAIDRLISIVLVGMAQVSVILSKFHIIASARKALACFFVIRAFILAITILLVLFVGRPKLTKDFGMTCLGSVLTKVAGIDDSLKAAASVTQAIVITAASPNQNSS
jgi:hypothetical protein